MGAEIRMTRGIDQGRDGDKMRSAFIVQQPRVGAQLQPLCASQQPRGHVARPIDSLPQGRDLFGRNIDHRESRAKTGHLRATNTIWWQW